jgi:hypothetical protein
MSRRQFNSVFLVDPDEAYAFRNPFDNQDFHTYQRRFPAVPSVEPGQKVPLPFLPGLSRNIR